MQEELWHVTIPVLDYIPHPLMYSLMESASMHMPDSGETIMTPAIR